MQSARIKQSSLQRLHGVFTRYIAIVTIANLSIIMPQALYADDLACRNDAGLMQENAGAVFLEHWEAEPDAKLAEIYGQGIAIEGPKPASDLAVILWDEGRQNERRPVRHVSDDGQGNIQGNYLRMNSQ